MKWSGFGLKRKSIQEQIKENENKYPLYDFLSFLMDYRGEHDLAIGIIGDRRETNIQEMRIRFGSEDTQVFKMGDLPVFDYEWFLKRPEMLLEHFIKDIQLVTARSQYDKIQEIVQHHKDTLEHYRSKGTGGLYKVMEYRVYENTIGLAERLKTAIKDGALFNERLNSLYLEYLEVANKSKEVTAPAPEMSAPVHDIIEVELLTILKDPDISDLTKSDAKETLDIYRQEKETVERNPKEDNARIAIQTIRKYYTNREPEGKVI